MTDHREYLSEDDARRLWARAAELQAEAARAAEEERALSAGGADDLDDPDDGDSRARDSGSGYDMVHVRAAALEAGIGEEFIAAALDDLQAERALSPTTAPSRRIAQWMLGNPPEFITVERTIRAEPRVVLSAMESVLPAEPYALSLLERSGDLDQAGSMTFDIPGAGLMNAGSPNFAGEASWSDFRQVHVTFRRTGEGTTHLVARAPIRWAWRINAGMGAGMIGLGSVLGGGAGMAGGLLASTALSAVVAAPLAVGVGVAIFAGATVSSAWGGLAGLRALYDYGVGRGEKAIRGMLAAVALRAEGGWGLGRDD